MKKHDRFSLLGAWALAFGCAVGWDALSIPWTALLPAAGPLGAALGILAGGLAMALVAWNFHFLLNRNPGPGGVYAYAKTAFGVDHGFLCAWFLCLTYAAITWGDATILVLVSRFAFGDVFRFGPSWKVAGLDVSAGHVLLSVGALAAAAAITCRRRLAARALVAMSLALCAGILACFAAAAHAHAGGVAAMGPAFAPDGVPRLAQVLGVLAVVPWMFIGFEAVSNISGEASFPLKRAFPVMAAAIGAAAVAYVLLVAVPVLAPGVGLSNWAAAVAAGADQLETAAFEAAARPLGASGRAIVGATLFCATFTNLVGNTLAASRLLGAMADDGALPAWFGHRAADGSPRNAALAVAAVSLVTSPLGQTIMGVILDTAIIGAVVAYAYASAAVFKTARAEGRLLSTATGAAGFALSVAMAFLFALPLLSDVAPIATESYLALALWCLAGLLAFLSVFHRDTHHRFGSSSVVWISLLAVILCLSVLWVRQTTHDASEQAFTRIEAAAGDPAVIRAVITDTERKVKRDSLVQASATVFAFALLFVLYRILVRRERETDLEKARAKSYFFSTVSHDIRTPLNAIIGYSEMLRAGFPTPGERDQAIDSILVSGRTLLGLVNDVLDLSKLESGKMEIFPEPTDVPALLARMADSFRASGTAAGIDIRARVGKMPLLLLDPQRLRQIVFNLAGNAVKFTERGHVELRAAWEPATGVLRLEVEDTGCGISKADRERIMSAYVQVGSKTARNGGTGLGLAICKQLATAMGGSLSVASELGRGSVFTVNVPGVRAADAPQPEAEKADAPQTPVAPAAPPPVPQHILVVDDVKVNLMVLKAQLRALGGLNVASAADGVEALAALRAPNAPPFDLVLTDIWMPNLDGEGLVRAIRADPALRGLRVIAVTADVEFQAKSAAAGFDGVLLKPVTGAKLAAFFGR